MVASDVSTWESPRIGLIDTGLEALRNQNEVNLVVDLTIR